MIVRAAAGLVAASRRRAGGGGGGAAPAFRAGTSNKGSSGATLTVNKPAGVAAGDFLVLLVNHSSTSGTAYTVPTGFTQVDERAVGSGRCGCFYRVADGSEGPTFSVVRSGTTGDWEILCLAYSGTAPVYDTHSVTTTGSGVTSHAATAVTTAQANERLVFLMTGSGFSDPAPGVTPPAGYTERVDGVFGAATWQSIYAADIAQAVAGSSGTPTATGPSASHYIVLLAVKG